jgi:hypothetical protein
MKTLADRVIEKLPKTVSLNYVDREDRITAKQLQAMFESPSASDDAESEIQDNFEDQGYQYMIEAIQDACKSVATDDEDANELYEELKADDDAFQGVKDEVRERDDSKLIADLTRNTPSELFRYRLVPEDSEIDGFAIPDSSQWDDKEIEDGVKSLAGFIGCDPVQYHGQLFELLANASYGGSPQIIWYGDVGELLASRVFGEDKWEVTKTITFKDPFIGVLNGWNGSGHDAQFKGLTLTLPYDPARILVDSAQGRYGSWDSVCGLNKSAYRTDVTLKSLDTEAIKV